MKTVGAPPPGWGENFFYLIIPTDLNMKFGPARQLEMRKKNSLYPITFPSLIVPMNSLDCGSNAFVPVIRLSHLIFV